MDDDKLFAVYRGDSFVAVGTLQELSKELGIKVKTLKWKSTPSGHKRGTYDKTLRVYKVEDDS